MLRSQNKLLALLLTATLLLAGAPASLAQKSRFNDSFTNQNENAALAVSNYNQGVQFFNQNQNQAGILAFSRALALNPGLTACHGPLGQLYFRDGQYEAAAKELKLAIAATPGSLSELATYWCLLAIAATHNDQADTAVQAFHEYLRLEPNGSYAAEALRSLKILAQKSVNTNPAHTGTNQTGCADHSNYLNHDANSLRRWRNQTLRVFIAPGENVSGYNPTYAELVKNALSQWSRTADGRIQFTLVNSPDQAQITCSWTAEPLRMKAEELGLTELHFNSNGEIQKAYIKLSTDCKDAVGEQDKLARVQAVAVHELGHALGLQHSDDCADVMFPSIAPPGLEYPISHRDRNTLAALYNSQ